MDEDVVGIRELKQNASEVIARVKRGDSVVVTDRGRPVGRIVPLTPSPVEELIAAGLLSEPSGSLAEVVGRVLTTGDPLVSSSVALDEIREERL
jgi:prevent-host-death family protein